MKKEVLTSRDCWNLSLALQKAIQDGTLEDDDVLTEEGKARMQALASYFAELSEQVPQEWHDDHTYLFEIECVGESVAGVRTV